MTWVGKTLSNRGKRWFRMISFLLNWNHRCPASSAYLNAMKASLPAFRCTHRPFEVSLTQVPPTHLDLGPGPSLIQLPRYWKTLERGRQDCISLQIWRSRTENNIYFKTNNLLSGHRCIKYWIGCGVITRPRECKTSCNISQQKIFAKGKKSVFYLRGMFGNCLGLG